MARDTTYRWISPLKASDYYVGHALHLDFDASSEWLRPHVEAGSVAVQFDGVEITPSIAKIILAYFDIKNPSDAGRLPSNFLLRRTDIERLLSRRTSASPKRPGRPKKSGSYVVADRPLVQEMNRLVSRGICRSPNAAAARLVDEGRGEGPSREAKIRRLVKRYKETFGDDA